MSPPQPTPPDPSGAWPFPTERTLDFIRRESTSEPLRGGAVQPSGRYQPASLHARGGLGEVFRARDAELHRVVALKRLPEVMARHAELRERFRREAEITACLEHPGIVPVYGMVEDELGRPSYAMRFIEGETLHRAVLDFFSELDAAPQRHEFARKAEFRQLLHRLIDACNTVAYAHSRRVIHRDIKPQNIMLGQFGETLLVDWGLAKQLPPQQTGRETVHVHAAETTRIKPPESTPPVLDRPAEVVPGAAAERHAEPTMIPHPDVPYLDGTPLTQLGQAVGTPQYMSPEQAAGDPNVGTASDIYNLGATLYFVLTGRPPFTATEWITVQHQVCTGDFPPPRQLRRTIPVELEAICLKAMAVHPEARYACSLDLAADLEKWLAHEPVSAWPEPLLLRAKRWVARHRGRVMALTMFLGAGLIASTVALIVSERAKSQLEDEKLKTERAFAITKTQHFLLNEALQDLQREQERTKQEQRNTEEALRLKTVQNRKSRDGLVAALMLLDEQVFTRQHGNAITPEVRAFLNDLSVYFQEFADDEEFPAHTQEGFLFRRSTAQAVVRVATIHRRLGHLKEAENGFLAAQKLYANLLVKMPGAPCCTSAMGFIYDQLATLRSAQGRWNEALDSHKEAEKLLRSLVSKTRGMVEYRHGLASILHNYALTLDELKRHTEADVLFKEAGTIREQLAKAHLKSPAIQQALAAHYVNLAKSLNNRHKYTEAVAQARRALPLLQKFVEQYAEDREKYQALAVCQADLGQYLANLEQWPAAEEMLGQAMRTQERLYAAFPSDAGYALQLGLTYCNLAMLRRQAGDSARALQLTDLALNVVQPLRRRDAWTVQARKLLLEVYAERVQLYLAQHLPLLALMNAEAALALNEPERRTESLVLLSQAAVMAGRYGQAYQCALEAFASKDVSARSCYPLACAFARLAAVVPDFVPARQTLVARAVDLLEQAEDGHVFHTSAMRLQLAAAKDFAALRDHPGFIHLCSRVMGAEWLLRIGWRAGPPAAAAQRLVRGMTWPV